MEFYILEYMTETWLKADDQDSTKSIGDVTPDGRHGVNSILSIPIPLNSIWSSPIPIPPQIYQFLFNSNSNIFNSNSDSFFWLNIFYHDLILRVPTWNTYSE